jgi:hypothetical protein
VEYVIDPAKIHAFERCARSFPGPVPRAGVHAARSMLNCLVIGMADLASPFGAGSGHRRMLGTCKQ